MIIWSRERSSIIESHCLDEGIVVIFFCPLGFLEGDKNNYGSHTVDIANINDD